MRGISTGLGVLIPLVCGGPVGAMAATRYVAANGAGTACTLAAPCRTIGQAITIAAAGDRIVVGPGVYGDVDKDGGYTTAGDETAQVGSGCGCVINIDKRLTLESSAGAAATVIQSVRIDEHVIRVEAFTAEGTVIGRRDKGVTIRGGGRGIQVAADDVRVEGNERRHPRVRMGPRHHRQLRHGKP